MSNTRKLWLLTIFSCVTLVSDGAFADYQTTADYSAGRKIVASKAYVDSQVDSAYTTLDNAKQNKQIGATGTAQNPSTDANKPVMVGVDGKMVMGSDALATVATSGSYNDLSDTPTIPTVNDATLTVTQNGQSAGTFTANADSPGTIAIVAPSWDAGVGAAGEILNKPTIKTAASDITGATSAGTKDLPTAYAVQQYVHSNPEQWITANDVPAQQNANWDATTGVTQITNKPTISNDASDITGAVSTDVKELPTTYAVQQYVNKSGKTFTAADFDSGVSTAAAVATNMNTNLSDEKLTTERKAWDIARYTYGPGDNVVITNNYDEEGQVSVSVPGVSTIDGVTGGGNSDDAKIPTVGAVESYVASNPQNYLTSHQDIGGKQNKPSTSANGKVLTYTGSDPNSGMTAKYVHVPVATGDPSADSNPASPTDFASIWVQ